MKISELTNEQGLDALCEMTPYLGNILEDADLVAELRKKIRLEDDASRVEIYSAFIQKMTKLVPIVLKTHRKDVYGIVAAVNGVPYETVNKQNFLKTMQDISDIVNDKTFKDFFKSLRGTDAE